MVVLRLFLADLSCEGERLEGVFLVAFVYNLLDSN